MKQLLRRLVVVPILAMVAGLLLVTAGPASAAGSCSVVVPRRLAISSPVQTFHARLAGDCARAHMDFASWNVTHPAVGVSDILIFDAGQVSDSWRFYDWEHLGTYQVVPRSAWDVSSHPLSENTGRMSIRLVSHVSLRVTRSGKFVILRSTATRYRPSVSGFRPWSGKLVSLGYRTCETCRWHHIGTRRTDRHGRIRSRRVSAPSIRQFRARLTRMSTTWGSTSGAVRG
jgi:hypothetical protein